MRRMRLAVLLTAFVPVLAASAPAQEKNTTPSAANGRRRRAATPTAAICWRGHGTVGGSAKRLAGASAIRSITCMAAAPSNITVSRRIGVPPGARSLAAGVTHAVSQ